MLLLILLFPGGIPEMMFDSIRLQRLQFMDRCDCIPEGFLHVFDFGTALVRIFCVFHQVQGGFKNVGDIEDRGIRHSVLDSAGQGALTPNLGFGAKQIT